ncbi:ABC transporter permease [Candidatus Bathyarchaeota archaeon]|nr:ABC transporter permease [Candidatus Bathyarchaeota archaeon]
MQSLARLRGVGFNALALAVGILAGLGLIAVIGGNLRLATISLLLSPISSTYGFAEIFVRVTVLLIMGLGIALGLRAGLWNVGAEGQYIVGSVMAIAAAFYLTSVPPLLRIVLMMLAGAAGGLIWMVVPAVLKARFGANEIIVTLLLNLIASNFLLYALDGPIRGKASFGYLISDILPPELRIPKILPQTRLGLGIVIAAGLVVVFYLLTERTSFGLQVRTVGRNLQAARYAGIRIPRIIMLTLLLSGAMAGLAGAVHVSGVIFTLDPGYPSGYGFIAIIVAMLGGASVIGTTIAAVVISYFVVGAEAMQSAAGVPFALVYTIEGIILFSLAAGQYLMTIRKK